MALWKFVLFMMFLPPAVIYHLSKIFMGKHKAHDFFYDVIVKISAKVLVLNIPTLKKDESFYTFSNNFKKAFKFMPFEKIDVDIDNESTFKIKVTRCQFTEVFQLLGIKDLTKALCEGDEVFCQKFQPRLTFKRNHTIEQGDDYCDHTFIDKR